MKYLLDFIPEWREDGAKELTVTVVRHQLTGSIRTIGLTEKGKFF